MKHLLLSLVIASNVLLGQNLPVVDNSAWFPPARTQYWNSCQTFSLTYYLKSYLWNKKFQRDPNLPENQFSPYFVWNQIIGPTYHWAEANGTFDFLSTQGAATVADFPMVDNPSAGYQETMPSLDVKEKALTFLSVGLKNIRIRGQDSVGTAEYIAQLKDSLAKGACFALGFPLFHYIENLYNQSPAVYKCFAGISRDSMYGSHMAIVVGYDDNIGGFKIINSWGQQFGDNGFFYFDYKWFSLAPWQTFDVYFLQEDFEHQSKLSLNLEVSNFITGVDRANVNNIIIDTLYIDRLGRKVDFPDFNAYFYFPNLLRLLEVNGKKVSDKNTNLFMTAHNHNSSYQLISDLSDYSRADSFSSAVVIMSDPISASFIGADGHTVYEYQRQPQAEIKNAYVRFVGSNRKVVGREVSLPDTTVICENYYSFQMTYHEGGFEVFVKQSTCTFARKLVTFNISDIADTNQAPVFTAIPLDTLKTNTTSSVSFQFQASDPDGDSLKYSVSGATEANIDSLTGLFTYQSNQSGVKALKVMVTDGVGAAIDSFVVKVVSAPDTNRLPIFTAIPSDTLKTNTTSSVSFQFKAMDPDGDSLKYSVSGATEANIDSLTGLFTYRSNQSGIYDLQVKVTDGIGVAVDSFIVKVETTTGVADENLVPVEYSLAQNYPNPFNPTTVINFSITKSGFVTLKVYNLLGQAVAILVEKYLPIGSHSVSFDAGRLASGVYLYKIQANEFSVTKKMVLSK